MNPNSLRELSWSSTEAGQHTKIKFWFEWTEGVSRRPTEAKLIELGLGYVADELEV